jgi:Arm DNA-binding domain
MKKITQTEIEMREGPEGLWAGTRTDRPEGREEREKIKLTQQIVDGAICPPDQPEAVWHDKELRGLQLRVKRSGAKSYTMRYRTGGRGSPQRRLTLDAGKISLGEARREIRCRMGEIATGRDPAGERQAQRKRDRARLSVALDTYETHLARRQVVKRGEVLSLLRRELERTFGNIDLADLDRQQIAERIAKIEASGRPGAARELKVRANVFLGWAVGEGLIPANPIAGWRRLALPAPSASPRSDVPSPITSYRRSGRPSAPPRGRSTATSRCFYCADSAVPRQRPCAGRTSIPTRPRGRSRPRSARAVASMSYRCRRWPWISSALQDAPRLRWFFQGATAASCRGGESGSRRCVRRLV